MGRDTPIGEGAIGDTIFGPDPSVTDHGSSEETLRIVYQKAESRVVYQRAETRTVYQRVEP